MVDDENVEITQPADLVETPDGRTLWVPGGDPMPSRVQAAIKRLNNGFITQSDMARVLDWILDQKRKYPSQYVA